MSAAASFIVGTPCARPTSIHSARPIWPRGSAKFRKNIMAVRSLIAASSSSRVSTQTIFAPTSSIWAW